jgi:hypothetical protein
MRLQQEVWRRFVLIQIPREDARLYGVPADLDCFLRQHLRALGRGLEEGQM